MPDIFVSEKKLKEATPKDPKSESDRGHLSESQFREFKEKEVRKLRLKEKQSALSAFYYFPKHVSFETKESEEKIVLLLRRHPITNVPWIIAAFFMLFAPLVVSFFPIVSFLPERFQVVAVMGWYLITTAFIIENFLSWFFNVNIVTDERIVDIDFHNLIYKEVSDTKIENIQDVTYTMGGVARTVFNYGDIFVQTAAEVPAFDFLAVPKPDRVTRIIQDLMIEEEKEKLEGRVR